MHDASGNVRTFVIVLCVVCETVYTCIHMCMSVLYVCVHVHVYVYVCACTCVCVLHVCMHVCMSPKGSVAGKAAKALAIKTVRRGEACEDEEACKGVCVVRYT